MKHNLVLAADLGEHYPDDAETLREDDQPSLEKQCEPLPDLLVPPVGTPVQFYADGRGPLAAIITAQVTGSLVNLRVFQSLGIKDFVQAGIEFIDRERAVAMMASDGSLPESFCSNLPTE